MKRSNKLTWCMKFFFFMLVGLLSISFSGVAHADWSFGIGTGIFRLNIDGDIGYNIEHNNIGPVEVGVESTAKTPVRRNVNDRNPVHGPALQQRMGRLAGLRQGRQRGDHLANLLVVRASGDTGILGAPHLGGSDHLHGARDLSGVLDTLDPSTYLAKVCHSL